VVDVGYAHLFVDEASISQNDGNAAARGFLLGEQESSVDVVSAQVAYKF
jgi:long-chain fatty acid transport protein